MKVASIACLCLAIGAFLLGEKGLAITPIDRELDFVDQLSRHVGIMFIPMALCATGAFLWIAGRPRQTEMIMDAQIVE